jgi:Domain of unknown function (DUF4336)
VRNLIANMNDVASQLYEPLHEYKPFGPNIGIVDGPLEHLTVAGVRLPLPFPTRMTVVRLQGGDLFLHSPIAFNTSLAQQLSSMGRVRHLVSPNQSRAFPDAITWASPRVRQRARARGIAVQFKRDLKPQAPEEWRHEIDQTTIPGGVFGEFVFFHNESKTLILTDTIINFELDKLAEPWRFATRLSGMYYPHGQIFFGMRLPLLLQKQKTKVAVKRIVSWQPERIILSHGRCFETDGTAAIRRAFSWAL